MSLQEPPRWIQGMMAEAIATAKKQADVIKHQNRYAKYQNDPLGFIENVLGEKLTDEVKVMVESVRDNVITIAKSSNAVGKSHGAARIATWFYSVYSDAQVYVTAAPPESNLKRLLWGEIMSIVQKKPEVFKDHKITVLEIKRNSLSFMAGVTIPTTGDEAAREARFSGKHSPNLMFIVDEGDAVPDEVYRGIESCMSGGNTKLLILFNPRAQRGPVYEKEKSRGGKVVHLHAFNHPNVVTGEDIIPGAVDRNTTVRRIQEWTRPIMDHEPITEECFKVPDYLVGYEATANDGRAYPPLESGWRLVVETAFYYMVLARYPQQSTMQLISESWIHAARQRWDTYVAHHGETPPSGVQPVLGADIAEFGVDYNCVCLRYGGFVPRFTLWKGIDVLSSGDRILDIYLEKDSEIALIDGDGVGAGVAPYISRKARAMGADARAVGVKVSSKPTMKRQDETGEFYQLRDQLWWSLREWLRNDPIAMLPPDNMLLEELRYPTYEIMSNGSIKIMDKKKMRSGLKRSPDRTDSLLMTFAPMRRAKIRRIT